MPTKYGQPTGKELHFRSLEAADLLAKYARELAFQNDWTYAKAAEYARQKHPDLAEVELKGYTDDRETKVYTYTSLEAGGLIAQKAKKLAREERISYLAAVEKILSDPANKEIAVCYAQAD